MLISNTRSELETATVHHKPFVYIKYKAADKFNVSGATPKNINGRLQLNRVGENDGQCVSFVKAITQNGDHTKYWGQGKRVSKYVSLKKGTIIATFDSTGHYGNVPGTSYRHTGMVLSQNSNGITLLDQNWDTKGTKSAVGTHFLPYKGKHVNGASNYHVVE
ncbi:BPSL0067 family protein [Candidatus Gracilibacteria bacterium]|nr:BPSL0067 family protein [Candidatus Gracilibacteria bacterium]